MPHVKRCSRDRTGKCIRVTHVRITKHLSIESWQGHAGFTRVNWLTRAYNTNTCRRWIKRCYNLDNALNYLSTQLLLSSARSMRSVNISDIWRWPGNKVLCFMGSPLRGQIDKLSFRRLVCGDWRTPAKNYNAFIVFLARRALTPNCAKKYGLKFTSSKLPETALVMELKKTVCRNFWRLFEGIAQYKFQLAETFRTVRERNLEHLSSPDLMPTDCFLKSLVFFVQNRHFSVRVENERSTNLPVLRMSYMLSWTLENRLSFRKDSPNMTVKKRKLRRGWRGKKVMFPFILIPSVHT